MWPETMNLAPERYELFDFFVKFVEGNEKQGERFFL